MRRSCIHVELLYPRRSEIRIVLRRARRLIRQVVKQRLLDFASGSAYQGRPSSAPCSAHSMVMASPESCARRRLKCFGRAEFLAVALDDVMPTSISLAADLRADILELDSASLCTSGCHQRYAFALVICANCRAV